LKESIEGFWVLLEFFEGLGVEFVFFAVGGFFETNSFSNEGSIVFRWLPSGGAAEDAGIGAEHFKTPKDGDGRETAADSLADGFLKLGGHEYC